MAFVIEDGWLTKLLPHQIVVVRIKLQAEYVELYLYPYFAIIHPVIRSSLTHTSNHKSGDGLYPGKADWDSP